MLRSGELHTTQLTVLKLTKQAAPGLRSVQTTMRQPIPIHGQAVPPILLQTEFIGTGSML